MREGLGVARISSSRSSSGQARQAVLGAAPPAYG